MINDSTCRFKLVNHKSFYVELSGLIFATWKFIKCHYKRNYYNLSTLTKESQGWEFVSYKNPHIGTVVPVLEYLSILLEMTYEPPLPFSRSDALCTISFLSVNGASGLVNPSSVRD